MRATISPSRFYMGQFREIEVPLGLKEIFASLSA